MRTGGGRVALSEETRKTGHQLLDHECWAMGKDVHSSEGNLLCEFGFRQIRCPNGGMTQYELENALGEDLHVYLWGFGVFFGGETEGVFLGRRDFTPSQTFGRVEIHTRDYPDFGGPMPRLDLFLRGLSWFVNYELWITGRTPEGYRDQCLAGFPRKVLTGSEFCQRWKDLILCIEQHQHALDGAAETYNADNAVPVRPVSITLTRQSAE